MKAILGWAYWTVYQILSLGVSLSGIPLIALMAAIRLWEVRDGWLNIFPGRKVWAWKGGWLTALWGNDENGLADGTEWANLPGPGPEPTFKTAWYWAAWRNSANGMRLIPGACGNTGPKSRKDYSWGHVVTAGWRQELCVGTRHFGWQLDGNTCWPVIG